TLNTILHDDELEPAQRLITDLYNTGVDALIVQDMGILELDIPIQSGDLDMGVAAWFYAVWRNTTFQSLSRAGDRQRRKSGRLGR
ncbi:hypothetical protein ONJ87_27035, partial [Salmonella enterica subsp. enterica serovar Anatum]|nr:hypothetical protein [Salmonella enterica subsp. enterica serovar Anatum]